MSTRYRKLLRLYRTLGLRAFLARLLRLAVGAIYAKHTELLIVKRLGPDATSPHRHNALRIESITAAHAPLLERFNERYRTRQKVVASTCYVRNGYRGFAAFVGDALIGYWWWVSNTTDPALTHPCVERFELSLNDDEVFAFDYFIAPEYRDQGAAVKFLSSIYGELAALGYRGVWGSVDADNAPARWVYKLHGNRVVRRTISHEIVSSFLVQGWRVFIRNTRWNVTRPFEHRVLFSLGPRKVKRSGVGGVASDLSTHGV